MIYNRQGEEAQIQIVCLKKRTSLNCRVERRHSSDILII